MANNDTNSLLDSLLFTASNKWGIDENQIMENMNKIAFHESKNKSDAIQKGWHYSSLKWVATWHRGAEKLTIELENINDVMHVNFILIPRQNTTQHRRNK